MVRQASCDVSDRNDKGSPDTVWQILGSYCGSFSCSKTSAAQTQDPAPASRKETLQSESGKPLPSSRKVSRLCFSPVNHRSMFLSTSEPGTQVAGHSRCMDTWARRWGPSTKSPPHTCPMQPCRDTHLPKPTLRMAVQKCFYLFHRQGRQGMQTPSSWPR